MKRREKYSNIRRENKKPFYKRKIIWVILVAILFIWLNNTSIFVEKNTHVPELLAHRGLAQTFDIDGVKWDTNTAAIIHKPEHPYIENTIESMEVAFDYGADLVEFDIRLTKDNQLAVIHDFELSYRTDGQGLVSDHTMEELRRLDVGYGYTHDGGITYPLRGSGVGMLVSIEEVLSHFPDKAFLIHIKDGGMVAAHRLEEIFTAMTQEQRENISIYGNEEAVVYIHKKFPHMKVLTKSIMIKALLQYELIGWTGYIPKAMENKEIHLPQKYAKFLWGWPDKFFDRMDRANSRFVLVNGDGGYSTGFNNEEDLKQLPKGYAGALWTDRIDLVALYYDVK